MNKTLHLKLFACLFTMSCVNDVLAGDMGAQTATQPSWQGFYIGGQVGGAWSRANFQYQNANFFNTLGSELLGNDFEFNTRSFIGGGYAGFNYQMATPWLIGLEGSFSGTNLNNTHPSPLFQTDRYTNNLNELGTLKGRVGYSFDRWLPYFSGGWAIANTSLTLKSPAVEIAQATRSSWNNGWIVGVGMDYRATSKVSVGVSYDYSEININNESVNCTGCGSGVGFGTPVVDGKFKVQAVMARVSYLINQ